MPLTTETRPYRRNPCNSTNLRLRTLAELAVDLTGERRELGVVRLWSGYLDKVAPCGEGDDAVLELVEEDGARPEAAQGEVGFPSFASSPGPLLLG